MHKGSYLGGIHGELKPEIHKKQIKENKADQEESVYIVVHAQKHSSWLKRG